ncbi:Stealth CR1 domain-containing protein [Tenacibaculum sp. SG-28]|nr:Stealth CR1 domain-containing protein [Tenacibaculum sp. SG-28]
MNDVLKYQIDAVITWVDGGDENHQKKCYPI